MRATGDRAGQIYWDVRYHFLLLTKNEEKKNFFYCLDIANFLLIRCMSILYNVLLFKERKILLYLLTQFGKKRQTINKTNIRNWVEQNI